MASRRANGRVIAVAAALVVAGCAKSDWTHCPTGAFCPPGARCAASAPQCIWDDCGNGRLDPGEACDDGNVTDGDGCNKTCTSTEQCGNGVIDYEVGEVCDWGISGQPCAIDCKSTEACGDGVTEYALGEECDLGAGGNGDDKDCTSNCKWNVCGDTHVNATMAPDGRPKEDCDEGVSSIPYRAECPYTRDARVDCQVCSQCRLETRPARYCGDGQVDSVDGEACDDFRSFACGTCGAPGSGAASCQPAAPAAATGSIEVVGTGTDLDRVTFSLSASAYDVPTVFELVNGGKAHPGNVAVSIATTDGGIKSRPDVAEAIRVAVNGEAQLGISAAHAAGSRVVQLVNDGPGVNGNVGIAVGDGAQLAATVMAGGRGCTAGQQCRVGDDCVPGLDCVAGFCR